MKITDLMHTPLLRNADIIAGGAGAERSVFWVVPDTIYQNETGVTNDVSLLPGSILLHTGSLNILRSHGYWDFLKKQEVSGLLLLGKPESVLSGNSPEDSKKLLNAEGICRFFDGENIPLVYLKSSVNALSFMKQVSAAISHDMNEEQRQEEWLRNLCYSENLIPSHMIAKRYGYVDTVKYFCVDFRMKSKADDYQLEYDMRRLKNIVEERFCIQEAKPLQFIDYDELVCFLPIPEGEDRRRRQRRVENVIQWMREMLPKNREIKVRASASLNGYSLESFSQGFRKMKRTEELIRSLRVHEPLSCYENWSMHMLLLREPRTELMSYIEQVLGELCVDEMLLETLTAYLTSGENLKNTAETLYIHINTLKYRLEKISGMLECDLKDPETRFRLRMAITVYRYLNTQRNL